MRLNEQGLADREAWEMAGYRLPEFDRKKVREKTKRNPEWIHFGAGNIFRAFQANAVQTLLNQGSYDKGLIVAEGFDYEIIDRCNRPHDDYSILVTLKSDGTMEKTVVGSIVESLKVDSADEAEFSRLREIFCSDSLKMISFTITEKGYKLANQDGMLYPDVEGDMEKGPKSAKSYMGKVTALMYERYLSGEKPVALVSMDNCSHNGDKLREAVLAFAKAWVARNIADGGFIHYLCDRTKVSFPWTMIDKITPRPDPKVEELLRKDGLEEAAPIITSRKTYVAPFVNAEESQYLVIEDWFPNGRIPLESAGIIYTDRETVDKVEKMKVCTCLNPLHTALAVFGCLLGYTRICDEMKDMDLVHLIKEVGYAEGLPVVVDPKIMNPKDFIDQVMEVRLPNPFMPDTPQRIATDTSQKMAIRYGETLKAYERTNRSTEALIGIPLVIAGWLRYLMGVDDWGKAFTLSPDPMLGALCPVVEGMEEKDADDIHAALEPVLKNEAVFGVDLYKAGIGSRVEALFREMAAGKGAVRRTLGSFLPPKKTAKITYNTVIRSEFAGKPVEHAIASLARDIKKACVKTEERGTPIVIRKKKEEEECFELKISEDEIVVYAGDELGAIYGIYEVSRRGLKIQDFWFWNDQQVVQKEAYVMTKEEEYASKPYAVRYRGWFVNDETLLLGWSVERSQEKAFEMVFEALLRCGGNMVIPGTDVNAKRYRNMALSMGLWITHHHAEPLGAQMFIRAYPDLNPSYVEHKELFLKLWKEAIEEQKECKVIWNVGFRGQGDCPFWEGDPRYDTMEARGRLMSQIIQTQYDMVKEAVPDAVCCTNLYGETMELYRDGYLKLPEDVIKIWADNGYGKMVTRRQGNHNKRIPSLPDQKDQGRHGIYYHVSFYDLQAANHITMLPNSPEFVERELKEVVSRHGDWFWIINSSNVKPHVYYLDLISKLWKCGTADVKEHRNEYIKSYYGSTGADLIDECMKQYNEYAVAYGEQEDEHAGEQFANHVVRILVSQFMKDQTRRAEELLWATDAKTLKGQILWYQSLCRKGAEGYLEYQRSCERTALCLKEDAKALFEDSLLLQVRIYRHSYAGALHACNGMLLAMDQQEQQAFYEIGKAKEEFTAANEAMRAREHGKWHNFYQNECQVDVKQTAWVLGGLMAYIRNLGDGPHFYKWQREFESPKEDQKVWLLLNTTNHLQDEELFALMKEKFDK